MTSKEIARRGSKLLKEWKDMPIEEVVPALRKESDPMVRWLGSHSMKLCERVNAFAVEEEKK